MNGTPYLTSAEFKRKMISLKLPAPPQGWPASKFIDLARLSNECCATRHRYYWGCHACNLKVEIESAQIESEIRNHLDQHHANLKPSQQDSLVYNGYHFDHSQCFHTQESIRYEKEAKEIIANRAKEKLDYFAKTIEKMEQIANSQLDEKVIYDLIFELEQELREKNLSVGYYDEEHLEVMIQKCAWQYQVAFGLDAFMADIKQR